jgi:CheY-like chemotaxis protein
MDRAVPEPLGDGETILIVEDDPLVRNFAELCVQSFGYDAITAESSDDALRKFFEAGRIDVLFTDLVMPGGLSGWEVAERIRGENPDVHVIFSSGYAIESLKARRKLPEGVAFLGKPYRKAQLARCLKQAISGPT